MSNRVEELERFREDHPQVEYVDTVFFDLCGYPRGKRYPIAEAEKIFSDGVLVPAPTFLLDPRGASLNPLGYGYTDGDPDTALRPIEGTLAPTRWSGGRGSQMLMVLDERDERDESGMLFDPRNVLARSLRHLDEFGLKPVVAFELEFYLIASPSESGAAPTPAQLSDHGRADDRQLYCLERLDGHDKLLSEIIAACSEMGVPTSVLMSEFACGQYEITLKHVTDPLRAADHCCLFRQIVKRLARKHGCAATFLGKPFLDQTGSGMHIHMSLLDRDGHNVFSDVAPEGSKLLQQAIAGLLELQFDATAIYAPNVNSYRRYVAYACVPVTRTWAANNRSVAVRIPAGSETNRRFEHRVACADANPYLVLASVLAGVHHGISKQLDPGAPSFGDACQQIDPDFPTEWSTAIDRMAGSDLLKQYLGERYVEAYAEAKRLERAAFRAQIPKEEFDWYL